MPPETKKPRFKIVERNYGTDEDEPKDDETFNISELKKPKGSKKRFKMGTFIRNYSDEDLPQITKDEEK